MNLKHGLSGTAIYNTWWNMIRRCTNKNDKDYSLYGDRGITVCAYWTEFENFYSDMGDKPKGLTIERVDNAKGYFRENCEWATPLKQAHNRRRKKTNTTGMAGVYYLKKSKKYRAQIMTEGQRVSLGCFDNFEEAANARETKQLKSW